MRPAPPLSKILVYGVTGSGKSTLAEQIAVRLRLPYHSVDDLTWDPGWVPVADEIQRQRITAICATNEWVLDTAYSSWLDVPLSSADILVGLDLPRWTSLRRLIRRTASRTIRRTPMCNGNIESIRTLLSRDSIVLWHFRSFSRKRRRMRAWAETSPGPEVILLHTPAEVSAWLDSLC